MKIRNMFTYYIKLDFYSLVNISMLSFYGASKDWFFRYLFKHQFLVVKEKLKLD